MGHPVREKRTFRLDSGIALCLAAASLFALSSYFFPFFSDDALISLRYAERFTRGLGLTWDDYERVEGYTDLLWILLCSLPMKLGADGIWTARILDTLGAAIAVFAAAWGPIRLRWNAARAWFGALFLGTLAPLAVWAIGGLEHGFMAGLLVVGLVLVDRARHKSRMRARALLVAGIPWAALVLSRADGVVLVASLALGLALSSKWSWRALRDLALLLAPPVGAWAGQLAFRVLYYGDWIPNTARAKVAFTTERLGIGLHHARAGLFPLLPTFALLALLLVVTRGRRAYRAIPALTIFAGWTAYLISVGGDIFPGWRQLLLGLVPLGFALATLGQSAAQRLARPVIWAGALLIVFSGQLALQMRDSENVRAKTERWEWDGISVGPALKRAFSHRAPLMAVDAAGALPYWTGFPSLDLLGLNDRYLATHPPAWHGKDAAIGHDLGDPDYFLRRRPDFFAFCNAAGAERPCFRASQILVRKHEFKENYRVARFRGLAPRRSSGWLHLRLDGRLGVTEEEGRVVYPGYFLASRASGASAVLEGDDFVTPISSREPGVLEDVDLTPGHYLVKTDAKEPLLYSIRCSKRSAGAATERLIIEGGRKFDLLVAPRSGAVTLGRVEFERTEEEPTQSCAGAPLAVPAAALSSLEEGTSWMAPPAVLFDARGVHVKLDPTAAPGRELWLVGDNNDELWVALAFEGQTLATLTVPSVPEPGMRLRKVPLPAELEGRVLDDALVTPRRGDGSYSISGFFIR